MVKFSKGAVRGSLITLRAYASGEQATLDRYAVSYFCRSSDELVMRRLVQDQDDRNSPDVDQQDLYTMAEWVREKIELYRQNGEASIALEERLRIPSLDPRANPWIGTLVASHRLAIEEAKECQQSMHLRKPRSMINQYDFVDDEENAVKRRLRSHRALSWPRLRKESMTKKHAHQN
ncbi:MAG: hypothetical protein M1822_002621 [Bathelium mastoideum]|nr:MAG: hypothetical protein M1822_002621 [Bathelium mastoideum]